ncbi:granule-bound starch synthase 1, chloroplastic/amyloplastic-like isoform X1 [Mercurialis annua]|uniref:granule-bound starch synthase 1, chloroplastic/amyloplastic-like isoform X1 n=1 Tax=Mercurialis annua TaxID=3986 RepID=UPI00216016AC|nr:granule-bound starch synthase 1, chloroplastic/amyloplastic-like isoform X1 [Mercurialis annua]XP_050230288.1 granule-bound starch synthase 1, chloroplastic/amyloplastic-like isoform X1 [Mercurialis annua]XP_050230289.1 granule-bound starch synthase 1, chloroplastic/amyloplastic-like isoform X1 [Mercurialis annua]XP_050230290.1 granule-bound starch synthase 1, chloroplastic/amyloplastic-like isoform X1 [Mercurialis annua]XP_050230291.1 granule-bound starch synthase 1, chloroplastic/amyloplas
MATTAQFASRTSQLNSHDSSHFAFNSHILPHTGLRTLNMVDKLHLRSLAARAGKKISPATPNLKPTSITCSHGMSLVFVSTEVAPWSKTGGLGDVVGGLPPALAARGHRVMTVSPRYDQYKDAWDTCVSVEIKVGDRSEIVRFFHCYKRGVDRVFVDHPMFLEKVWGKTGSKIYGPAAGLDYQDNQLRFSLLCLAALEAPRVLNLNSNKNFSGPYGDNVVFIGNDWHTALLPCYLKSIYKPNGIYRSAKVAFCIHNIAYQGRFPFSEFSVLNLPDQFKSSFDFIDGYVKPVKGRKINWMKAGILESDRVLTVSPYYARELVSGVKRGVELDNIIRKIGITGIINGMDVQEWNPATDKYIGIKYEAATVMEAKPLLKEALQAEVGLPVDRNIPLIGFIGRLEEQKGSDIMVAAISQLAEYNVQIVILGTGKKAFEKQIGQLEVMYPDKCRGVAKFNVPLAHMIIAGADFMLIPSRFEPCGLIQLHAMRYGTVPIVASTGGLVDTVKEGYTGFQMGAFHVECDKVDPADVAAIVKTVIRALGTYATSALKEMILNCMSEDLSWKGPSKLWEKMLLGLEVAGSEPGIEGDEIAPLAKENVATP